MDFLINRKPYLDVCFAWTLNQVANDDLPCFEVTMRVCFLKSVSNLSIYLVIHIQHSWCPFAPFLMGTTWAHFLTPSRGWPLNHPLFWNNSMTKHSLMSVGRLIKRCEFMGSLLFQSEQPMKCRWPSKFFLMTIMGEWIISCAQIIELISFLTAELLSHLCIGSPPF